MPACPVREVLVADASRRTTKLNAYVSGLGATRRVVLYDTLVEKASEPEVLTVVAHELGHRRYRHVALGTALAMAGVGRVRRRSLGAALGRRPCWTRSTRRAPGDAHDRAFRAARRLAARARCSHRSQAALSRRWEYACDRFALEQTGDLGAFELGVRAASPRRTFPTRRRRGSPISGSSRTRRCRSVSQRRAGQRPWVRSRHDQSHASHQRRTDRARALSRTRRRRRSRTSPSSPATASTTGSSSTASSRTS